jgi:phosphoribosylformimino-5-aminoimidazole carboxamide ribotide isomerase
VIVIPAIDLRDGKCVRLSQGRPEATATYAGDPVDVARRWESEGAQRLHIVDLDGAFRGEPVHTRLIAAMVSAVRVPVQVGGGLRRREDVLRLRECGVDRVVLGTRAAEDPEFVGAMVAEFGAAVAAGIDARQGQVQVRGWKESTVLTALNLASSIEALGVQTVVYTDTARDGMLQGVNTAAVDMLCLRVTMNVIAAGGVSSAQDIRALVGLGHAHLTGAIVGKALYEGRADLAGLLAACRMA